MRYDLGVLDLYPIEASGTNIANSPLFKVTLKDNVDPVRLLDAVYKAIKFHPLFGTQLEFDGVYYFRENNRPIKLINASEVERPNKFGKETNGYMWQVCWDGKVIILEWCHGVSDGRGVLDFLNDILKIYFGEEMPPIPSKFPLDLGMEPYANKKENGINYKIGPKGCGASALPFLKRGYKSDMHIYETTAEELKKAASVNEGSPATVLAVLVSMALRRHVKKNAVNRNVACYIVVDMRKPLGIKTMHNCIDCKRITYQDRHDRMEFSQIVKEYKENLDNAIRRENIVRALTEKVNMIGKIFKIRNSRIRKNLCILVGKILKDSECNFSLTSVGKTGISKKVEENVDNYEFYCWPDIGECCVAVTEFKGIYRVSIIENYKDKGFLKDFETISLEHGIKWNNIDNRMYEQGQFISELNLNEKQYKQYKHRYGFPYR